MSTSALFGIERDNGYIRSIRINWEGTPDILGKGLVNLINANLKDCEYGELGDFLESFLDEGDRSTLQESYMDKGEVDYVGMDEIPLKRNESKIHLDDSWPQSGQDYEYFYSFDDNALFYRDMYEPEWILIEEF